MCELYELAGWEGGSAGVDMRCILWVSSKGAGRLHYQHVSGESAVGFTWKVMFWQLLLGQGPLSAPARTVTHYPGRCETSRGASEAPCPLAVYTVTKVRVA